MKIVHAADLHIDSPFRGLSLAPAKLPTQFHGATRQAFRNLIDLCLCEAAAMLLLAGDIFDTHCRNPDTGEFFRTELQRLRDVGTRVVMVYGNHDAECPVMRRLRLPEHVHCLCAERPQTLVFEDLGLAVHGQSYAQTAVWENLAGGYPSPLAGALNIGLLHTNAIAFMEDPLYAPCTVEELVGKGYAYWALGHIHWPQVLHRDPWVAYSGNLQTRYMEEAGPKGCMLIDVEDGRIRDVQQVLVDAVRWAQVQVPLLAEDVRFEGLTKIRAALEQARRQADGRPLVARIVLQGDGPDCDDGFARFVRGTRYASRVRVVARDMDWLWLEDVRVQEIATPAFGAARSLCGA